ncbi:MAG: cyclase family protein [Candidatus Poribacteria bacterium]|nr:cyclase family protein [Candidatus Poribacteria bacterium]
MMNAPTFRYSRVVDLSRPLVPDQAQHPWFRFGTRLDSIVSDPETAPPSGRWYVVTQIGMSGHAGTHVEAPLHAMQDGAAVGELPVERFFGEAAVLDLSDVTWSAPIDLPRLEEAARQAGGIRTGDIVLMRFDWDRRAAAEGGGPPYPTPAALRWLVDQEVKLLGIDSPGLEVPGSRELVNHHILFDRGIPLIESLAGLEDLHASRVYIFALPLPVFGTDAIPLRVLAFEGTPEGD